MVHAADVTAEDLVDSLLNSITSASGSAASSSASKSSVSGSTSAPASTSASSSSFSSSSQADGSVSTNAAVHPVPTAKTSAPTAPTATATTSAPTTSAPSTSVRGASGSAGGSEGGSGAAMGVGLAVAAIVMIACVFLYLRRRKRIKMSKARREQFGNVDELGPPQPSIELPLPSRPLYRPSQDPGVRGSSMYSPGSSARDGGASSVFNTVGALSSTSRKFGASNYAFRPSSLSSVSSSSASAGSTVQTANSNVHVIGAHSNLTAPAGSSRKLARVLSGREMDEEDEGESVEYEQLHSTSAAASAPLGDGSVAAAPSRPSNVGSVNSLHDSMSSDMFHHGDGLGKQETASSAPPQIPAQERNDQQLEQALDSSLIQGRTKRTGSVYDSIPALAGEQMHAESSTASISEPAPPTVDTGRRAPPPPPPMGVPAFQPAVEGGSYVAALPNSLSSFASADELEFAMDAPPPSFSSMHERESNVSTASSASSSDSASTRGGSLIALAETTHENGHEIAI